MKETEEADEQEQPENKRETMIRAHACQLSEHFDSVQIIATSRAPEGHTILSHWGKGNWYAREGSVREWLSVQEERTREQVRKENDE
jgi:hypothetical protein